VGSDIVKRQHVVLFVCVCVLISFLCSISALIIWLCSHALMQTIGYVAVDLIMDPATHSDDVVIIASDVVISNGFPVFREYHTWTFENVRDKPTPRLATKHIWA
jgi:hypothetical protein